MATFIEKYQSAVQKKNSLLCAGIDVAVPGQRSKNTIPEGRGRLDFSLEHINQVADFAAAIKPNRQYLIGMTLDEVRAINQAAHKEGMVSIIDHKIPDIGSTNDSAMYWISLEGFDATTYCPFPGNTEAAGAKANELGLGLIVLTLMSNPEFRAIKHAKFEMDGRVLDGYLYYAEQTAKYGHASVIGAPSKENHVTEAEIKEIADILGPNKGSLCPGVGAQGGFEKPIVMSFRDRAIINVGRDLMFNENPHKRAQFYQDRFNSHLGGE